MIEQFAVGEVAIMCNSTYTPYLNGMECTVVGEPQWFRMALYGNVLKFGYPVDAQDGLKYVCAPDQLRKKRPPESDDATARQAMLDCIERAKQPLEVGHG